MKNMWTDIEICGGHYVYKIEDGELYVETLNGEEVSQEVYDSVYEEIPPEVFSYA